MAVLPGCSLYIVVTLRKMFSELMIRKTVGEKMKDWDTAKATAEELKAKGYYTFASYADTFRLYGNSIESPWVESGETVIKVDQKIMDWVNDSKEWLDAGYLNKTVKGQWNDDWNKAMSSDSKVFAFLLPGMGNRLYPETKLGWRRR